MKNLTIMWRDTLVEIKNTTSQANFSTWFKDTSILREKAGTVYVGVPNSFTKEWLEKKFHNDISSILKRMEAGIDSVRYVIVRDGLEVCSSNDPDHRVKDRIDELNLNVYGLNEKFESFINRFVILTNKVESLIGKVGTLSSTITKSVK